MNDTPSFCLTVPDILRTTPSLLSDLVNCIDEGTIYWRPNEERWSAAMVIAHLAESEVTCFRARLRQVAEEEDPVLEPYDQWMHLRAHTKIDIPDTLKALQREREITLSYLGSLPISILHRRCHHSKLGELTFDNLLSEFAFHDMGHLRQILELCRASAYYPKMGNWRKYYNVNP